MTVEHAVTLWRGLDRLAGGHGKTMRIHLAGGEPFGDWPRLLGMVRAARDAGLTPLEKVETNAFWATSDGVARARLEQLAALGMERLVVSADVFHQQFVPFERVRRCVEMARQVLGQGRVIVRWWDFFQEPVDTQALSAAEREQVFAAALQQHPDRLNGRAADELSRYAALQPAEAFADERCVEEVLQSRHIHIDPIGNVFPGMCAGIILGNVGPDAGPDEVERLWLRLGERWREHRVVDAVTGGGSYALMRRAVAVGYRPRVAGYASKCHLCMDVRRFLCARGGWEDEVGPRTFYR